MIGSKTCLQESGINIGLSGLKSSRPLNYGWFGDSSPINPRAGGSLRDPIPFEVHRILCGERFKL
jgi:hypothetical protein